MRVASGAHEFSRDLARRCVGDVHLDGEHRELGQEHDATAVRAERRGHVQVAAVLACDEWTAERRDWPGGLDEGGVSPPRLFVPRGRKRFLVDAEHGFDGARDVAGDGGRVKHVANRLVAPAPADVRPERMSVAIGKEIGIVQLVDRRHLFTRRGIANPHRRVRVDRAYRQILGHPLDEPEGQRRHPAPASIATPCRDVVLKGVHELVAEDVIRFREPAGERKDDPALRGFRDSAGAFADLTGEHVGLLKMWMRCVEDQRLATAQVMLQ